MVRLEAPPIDPRLIEWLSELFPDRLPDYPITESAGVNTLVGQQQVIRRLREEAKRQTKNTLTG